MTGSDFGRMGDAIFAVMVWMFVALVIFVPLGIWKLVEIIIWALS
jgi:hypothetical protein